MTIPLVQTGPGGAYTRRYLRRGDRLLAVIGSEPPSADLHDDGRARAHEEHRFADEPLAPPTLLDRLLGIDRAEITPEALRRAEAHRGQPAVASTPSRRALFTAASRWLEAQSAQIERFLGSAAHALTASLNCESTVNSLAAARAISARTGGESIRELSPPLSNAYAGRARRIAAPLRQEKHHGNDPHSQATPHPATGPQLAGRPWLFPDDAGTRRRARHQQSHRLRAHRGAHQKGSPQTRAQQGTLFVPH